MCLLPLFYCNASMICQALLCISLCINRFFPMCKMNPTSFSRIHLMVSVTIDGLKWHTKVPIFCISVHCWCYTFYACGQMYNDIYPPLWYLEECFHCMKSFAFHVFIHPLFQPLASLIFLLCPQLCLFRNVIYLESWIHRLFVFSFYF